jgi:hypothetical protein
MEDELLAPLFASRDRIDAAIQGYLDKVALLRKRREALTAAVDIIRAGDDEIVKLPTLAERVKGKRTKVTDFDEQAIETQVLALLATSPRSFPEIIRGLDGAVYSVAGLRRILKTAPGIVRTGEREHTRYSRAWGKI